MIARVATRFVLPFALLLAAACGGDDGEAAPKAPLAPPPVSPSLTVHAQGDIPLSVQSEGTQLLDFYKTSLPPGVSVPCERFVVLMSWQVEGKRPLEFSKSDSSGDTKLLEGTEGVVSVTGCSVIKVTSNAKEPVAGKLKYVIAETP